MQVKNKKDSDFYKVKRVLKVFLPFAWKRHKGYFALSVFHLILTAAAPFVNIIISPLIISELLGDKNIERIIFLVALLIILNGAFSVLTSFLQIKKEKYAELFGNEITEELSIKAMEIDFQLTEDKTALDDLKAAREGMSWYSGGVTGVLSELFSLLANAVTIAGSGILIIFNAPVLLIVIIAILAVNTFANHKLNKVNLFYFKRLSKLNRTWEYYGWAMSDIRYGKDIRLYGAESLILDRFNKFSVASKENFSEQINKTLKYDYLMAINRTAFNIFTYFYLGLLVISGGITIAAFTQMLTAATTFERTISGLIENIQNIVKKCSYAESYVKFMEYPNAIPHGNKHIRNIPHVFEFKNVTFSYPKTDIKVLNGINLTLNAGERLSIVGLNGAGKTTLVKLLCRLYDVTDGEILLDGVNIKEYDYKEYMSLFSPVFQDFKLFAFSFKENITLGKNADEKEIITLSEKVGLHKLITTMDKGINNSLFRGFDETGVEPSGGEQQKIAIARALYKNSPVVILDEPTAALDPIAEYDIYRQFDTLVGGKTAIYISHRLSSCKFCDKIAVFANGIIKEYGTHDKLCGIENGIYAEMFAAQAQYYR